MKKTYTKPALFAESFELAEHIAKCDGVSDYAGIVSPQHWGGGSCKFIFNDNGVTETLFNVSDCTFVWGNNATYTCYDIPFANMKPFGS